MPPVHAHAAHPARHAEASARASRSAHAGLAGRRVDELLAAHASALAAPLGVIVEHLDRQAGAWQFSLDGGAHWQGVRTDILARPGPMGLALARDARLRVQPFAGSAHLHARIVLHAAQRAVQLDNGCYCPYAAEGREAAARSVTLELRLSDINATPPVSAPQPRNKHVRVARPNHAPGQASRCPPESP